MGRSPALPSRVAFAGSAFLLLGQAFRLSPLVDAADGSPLREAALRVPAGYLLTAPFSALADLITFSSSRQAAAWLAWLAGGYWLWRVFRPPVGAARALGGYLLYLAAVAAFLAWALLVPRPLATLRAPPGSLVIDFHSHSTCSHDGRRAFTSAANAAWHARAGFDAGFLTDHNVESCARARAGVKGYVPLAGVELSLQGAHVVALAPRGEVPVARYQAGEAGLESFLVDAGRVFGAAPILSLPEYWEHHWGELDRLASLPAPGAGLEIANGAPKALEFPDAARDAAVAVARRHGLFLACATDQHGWSQAPYCWNVMRLRGAATAEGLQDGVLDALRHGGSETVLVAARRRVEPSRGWRVLLDPFLGLWTLSRCLTRPLAAASAAWLWVLCGAWRADPGRRARRAPLSH